MEMNQLIKGIYDLQQLRVQTGLRIVAASKEKLGEEPNTKETKITPEAQKILQQLRNDYVHITYDMIGKKFKGYGLIDNYLEYLSIQQYIMLLEAEEAQFNALKYVLKEIPFYEQLLRHNKGLI